MTGKKALERWKAKIDITEITPRAIWTYAKSLLKRDGPRTLTDIHGPQALNFIRPRKPTKLLTAWKISSHHDLCDKNHKRRVEARVQALLDAAESKPLRE
jgi:hypothetical protein